MSVGSVLAQARQARGWSLDDVSVATRIRPHLVAAIEADDLTPCGGAVYARGHVRAIAAALGVDPVPLLAELARNPVLRPVSSGRSDINAGRRVRERPVRRRWSHALAVGAAAVLGTVCTLAALQLVLPERGGQQRARGPVLTTPSESAEPRTVTPPPAAPRPALRVTVKVIGERSWVGVRDSKGESRLASILNHGESAHFSDRAGLSLTIGSAKAVQILVNGQRYRPDDWKGVQHVELGPADARAALAADRLARRST